MMKKALLACALMSVPTYCAAADKPAQIDVALGDVSLQKVPYLIAADAGIYEKNGLRVHQFITPRAAEAAAEAHVIVPPENIGTPDEKAPIMVGGGAALVAAVGAGRMKVSDVVIVATNENIVRDHIITRGDIRTEQELKGKRLGSSYGNVTGYDGIAYLERVGLSKEVMIVPPTNLDALRDGKADAVMATLFQSAQAPDRGFFDLVDVGRYHIPEAGSGVWVDRAWLKDNPEIVQRFLRSMVEGIRRMKSDKALFTSTLKRWFNVADPKLVDRLFAMAQEFPEEPYPSAEGIAKAMRAFPAEGLNGLTAESFYDNKPMQRLLGSHARPKEN